MRLPERFEKIAEKSKRTVLASPISKAAINLKSNAEILAVSSKRTVLASPIGRSAIAIKKHVHLPQKAHEYLKVPSQSMLPITITGATLSAGFNISQEIPHVYSTGLTIGIAIGGTILRNHFRQQEQATQPLVVHSHAKELPVELAPVPEVKSA